MKQVHRKLIFSLGLLMILPFVQIKNIQAETIHRERSLYRNIVIVEENGVRCMRFETRKGGIHNQACMDLNAPEKLVFEYTHSIMAALFLQDHPKSVLVIGLGGGLLPRALHQILPTTVVTSVEIDPAVVKLAKQYFLYQENEQIQTVVQDGRVFIKRAGIKGKQFDWIILDAFTGDYIPEHLMTQEFLQEVKAILNPDGVVTANTFSSSRLYDYESATYHSVFGEFFNLRSPHKGNRVIIGCRCNIGQAEGRLGASAERWKVAFKPFALNTYQLVKLFSRKVDWKKDSPVLTDQFSPANLLNQ